MALAAKRRRLSQADPPGPSSQPLPEDAGKEDDHEGKPLPAKKRRGRPPKVQRVWSPSGGQCGCDYQVRGQIPICVSEEMSR